MLKRMAIICIIALIISIYLSNTAFAIDDVISSAEGFLGEANNNPINDVIIQDTSNYLYSILFTIAIALAVAIGIVIGIQFILGSVEEQAKVKEKSVKTISQR